MPRGRTPTYPFATMNVGDEHIVTIPLGLTLIQTENRIQSARRKYVQRTGHHLSLSFHLDPQGIKIRRTA